MNWAALLVNLIKIVSMFFEKLERRQLINDAEARLISRQLGKLNDRVKEAVAARDRIRIDSGLHDDDGYRVD